MPRRSVVVGNWKSNKTVAEARRIAMRLRAGLERNSDVDVLVAPPFTAFEAVAEVLGGSNIQLAAQNVHWEGQGPWTGEITTDHLIDLDCHFVIVGHSERRQFFNDPHPPPRLLIFGFKRLSRKAFLRLFASVKPWKRGTKGELRRLSLVIWRGL